MWYFSNSSVGKPCSETTMPGCREALCQMAHKTNIIIFLSLINPYYVILISEMWKLVYMLTLNCTSSRLLRVAMCLLCSGSGWQPETQKKPSDSCH